MAKGEALNPKDPELTSLTQAAGKYAQDIAWFAAQRALRSTPVEEAPVPSILECLRTSEIRAAIRQREALASLVERLDASYWAASDSVPQDERAANVSFRRARAANSLLAALQPDVVQAALDAVYEAYHALPEEEADPFVEEVKDKLRYYANLP